MRSLTAAHLSEFRRELGRIPRQVSGFHLANLLPENGFNVARALVRSEPRRVLERTEAGWRPRGALPPEATVQAHWHEYAVFGTAVQRRALHAVGIPEVREATGCCGAAGNFGFDAAHYEVSMQVAEQPLSPALRDTAADTVVLTDGFSCHMPVRQLLPGSASLHLAELLDQATDFPAARSVGR